MMMMMKMYLSWGGNGSRRGGDARTRARAWTLSGALGCDRLYGVGGLLGKGRTAHMVVVGRTSRIAAPGGHSCPLW